MTESTEPLTAERRMLGEPPRRRSLRAVMAAVAIVALLAVAYTIYWFSAADELRKAADRWRDERRAMGETVAWQSFTVGGYPFWLRATVTATQWAREDPSHPWSWEASRVAAKVRPWNFQQVSLDLSGDHRVAWSDGSRHLTYTGTADRLTSSLAVEAGKIDGATFALAGLQLDGGAELGKLRIDAADATIRRPSVPPPDHLGVSWSITFDGRGLVLPEPPVIPTLPLGRQVARVMLDANILGNIPAGPLDTGLVRWREDGGTVEVKNLRLDWGPFIVQGDGTIALDAALQPIGAFSAKAQGFFETLEILRQQGLVDKQAANTARLVLGVMARPSADGGAAISVPVSIQNRTIFAGPIMVARFNPIIWTGSLPIF